MVHWDACLLTQVLRGPICFVPGGTDNPPSSPLSFCPFPPTYSHPAHPRRTPLAQNTTHGTMIQRPTDKQPPRESHALMQPFQLTVPAPDVPTVTQNLPGSLDTRPTDSISFLQLLSRLSSCALCLPIWNRQAPPKPLEIWSFLVLLQGNPLSSEAAREPVL